MKTYIFTLVILIFTISCASVEKMAKKGDYDGAFEYALSKIKKGRSLKTKEVVALEQVYSKLNNRNLAEIDALNANISIDKLERMINLYSRLNQRNQALDHLMPIKSKDGYHGVFTIVNYTNQKNDAIEDYCELVMVESKQILDRAETTSNKNLAIQAKSHASLIDKYKSHYEGLAYLKTKATDTYCDIVYAEANKMLVDAQATQNKDLARQASIHAGLIDAHTSQYDGLSVFKAKAIDTYCDIVYAEAQEMILAAKRNNNKDLAKRAFEHLSLIEKYTANYPGLRELKSRALEHGKSVIAVKIESGLNGYMGREIEKTISDLRISQHDNLWYDYTMDDVSNPDIVMSIVLENLDLGRENERYNHYVDYKEICVRKERVKEKRDTVEIWVEKEVFEKVTAHVTEVWRERGSVLNGALVVMDAHTGEYIKKVPINAIFNFDGYGCNFVGDSRALSHNTTVKLDSYIEQFPSDIAMVDHMATKFRDVVLNESRSLKK
jgi:hypothetical protein